MNWNRLPKTRSEPIRGARTCILAGDGLRQAISVHVSPYLWGSSEAAPAFVKISH